MGAVLSIVQDAYFTTLKALKALLTLNTQFQALLLRRASSPPGLPVPEPTSSYWLDDPPFPHMTSPQPSLPEETEIIIIGSGVTGAAVAKTILELSPSERTPSVVVCEARDVCGGATGRNGGHIKCAPYMSFATLRGKLGNEKARELVRFQRKHLDVLLQVGEDVPEGEARKVETVDLYLEEKDFDEAKRHAEEMREWLPEEKYRVLSGEEAREEFGVNEQVTGAIAYTAGALWPYRLVAGVWNALAKEYPSLTISAHTAVESVTCKDSSSHPYEIKTSRGSLKAKHVIHATNAFAPQLVPSLRGRLTGALAHMTSQRPGDAFPSSGGKRSWSVIYAPGFDYITQRPDREDGTPGDLMIGGGFYRSKEQGLDQIGAWDDSRTDALPLMHIRGTMPTVFEPKWGYGGGLNKAWTGVLGFTGDTLPFVGRVPRSASEPSKSKESGGQWISAGYNGRGMVWAWLCGAALGIMVLGKEDEELEPARGRPGGRLAEWFPRDELKIDDARLKRADLKNMAD